MKQELQTNFSDGSNIFFTSDTHFSHPHIMKYCNRPWDDVNKMNEDLIKNWNSVVSKDSVIFHLGDFAWGKNWTPILNQLNGRKILILGNHDMRNMDKDAIKNCFEHVSQQLYIKIEHRRVMLNHCPFLCYGGTYRENEDKVYQLFGHVHSGPYSDKSLDNERLLNLFPTQYDVGVDNNNFTPVSWKEVNTKIQNQILNNKNEYEK